MINKYRSLLRIRRARPRLGTKLYLARIMTHWLWDAGYARCPKCELWKKQRAVGLCNPCDSKRRSSKTKIARGIWSPSEPEIDFSPKANAYFERQVLLAPHYYTELRTQHSSPIAGMA